MSALHFATLAGHGIEIDPAEVVIDGLDAKDVAQARGFCWHRFSCLLFTALLAWHAYPPLSGRSNHSLVDFGFAATRLLPYKDGAGGPHRHPRPA